MARLLALAAPVLRIAVAAATVLRIIARATPWWWRLFDLLRLGLLIGLRTLLLLLSLWPLPLRLLLPALRLLLFALLLLLLLLRLLRLLRLPLFLSLL